MTEFIIKQKILLAAILLSTPVTWFFFYEFVPRDVFIGILIISVGFLYFWIRYATEKEEREKTEAKMDELRHDLKTMREMNEEQIRKKLELIEIWYRKR